MIFIDIIASKHKNSGHIFYFLIPNLIDSTPTLRSLVFFMAKVPVNEAILPQ